VAQLTQAGGNLARSQSRTVGEQDTHDARVANRSPEGQLLPRSPVYRRLAWQPRGSRLLGSRDRGRLKTDFKFTRSGLVLELGVPLRNYSDVEGAASPHADTDSRGDDPRRRRLVTAGRSRRDQRPTAIVLSGINCLTRAHTSPSPAEPRQLAPPPYS
jgi:hypothetical protein